MKLFDHSRRAFTLLEMLIVIGLISLLLAMTAPNLFSLLRATELSGQGAIVKNQLTLAQQTALSTNADVEVRFYKFKDIYNVNAVELYRAFQFFQYDNGGKIVPISEIFRIQEPVVLHPDSEYSNILAEKERGQAQRKAANITNDELSQAEQKEVGENRVEGEDLNRFSLGVDSARYISFRFLPDGSTNLPKRTKPPWFMTLVEEQSLQNKELYNYYCIQIDPFNGSIREYRPGL